MTRALIGLWVGFGWVCVPVVWGQGAARGPASDGMNGSSRVGNQGWVGQDVYH